MDTSKNYFGFKTNEITLSNDLSTMETPSKESIKKEGGNIDYNDTPYINGIINNVNGKNTFVYLTPTIIGLIK